MFYNLYNSMIYDIMLSRKWEEMYVSYVLYAVES